MLCGEASNTSAFGNEDLFLGQPDFVFVETGLVGSWRFNLAQWFSNCSFKLLGHLPKNKWGKNELGVVLNPSLKSLVPRFNQRRPSILCSFYSIIPGFKSSFDERVPMIWKMSQNH